MASSIVQQANKWHSKILGDETLRRTHKNNGGWLKDDKNRDLLVVKGV